MREELQQRYAVAAGQQREAAQPDAGEDRGAASDLLRPGRVTERQDARYRADQRFEVEEGAGHLGGHASLSVGEQRERQHRAARDKPGGGQGRAQAGGCCGHPAGEHCERQRGQRSAEELHAGDLDRVAAGQHPGLPDGERGGQQQRGEHQAVTAGRRAAPAAGDQADSGQRDRETHPGHRARHGVLP